jgi:hypothetical protein
LSDFNTPNRPPKATLFHLLMYASGRALMVYPHLNRFISGRHIYQHRDVNLTFAAKKVMTPESPFTMIKIPLAPNDTFEDFIDLTTGKIKKGRQDTSHHSSDKLDLLLRCPGFVVGAAVGLWRLADRWNLLPASWLRDDPMYTSVCFTNLGSVGLNDIYHHLSEYGTASLFSAMGKQQKTLFVSKGGKPEVRDGLQVRWSADERIADGFYTAKILQLIRETIEDPATHVITRISQQSSAASPQSANAGPPSR